MTYATDLLADTARRLHEIGYTWDEIADGARITAENADYISKQEQP